MPARSMLMLTGYSDSLLLTERLRSAEADATRTVPAAQYKSANVIETAHSLLPSQRRMDNLDTASPAHVSWGVVVSLIILSTIGALIYAAIFNRKQRSFRVKLSPTIACSRCRYFNDNHFLNCALHPVTVLTEQAVDCQDYYQKAKAKWFEDLNEYY